MNSSHIKVKAYAVFRRGKEILVNEVRESMAYWKVSAFRGGMLSSANMHLMLFSVKFWKSWGRKSKISNFCRSSKMFLSIIISLAMRWFSPLQQISKTNHFMSARPSKHSNVPTSTILHCSGKTRRNAHLEHVSFQPGWKIFLNKKSRR